MALPLEIRIKNIQKQLQVNQTGVFDMDTCIAFESRRSMNLTSTDLTVHRKEIQKSLGFTGKDVDGLYGVATISRIEMIFDSTVPALPPGTSMIVSKRGLDIIIESEVTGKSAYNTKYKSPVWPGGDSGITIGIGYDLGYYNASKITGDWSTLIPAQDLSKLISVSGLKGEKAKNSLTDYIKSVVVPWEAALEVFYTKSLPKYAGDTKTIYPGINLLPPDAQAAIVSLIYNRGSSLTDAPGDTNRRREEMRNIVPLVRAKNLQAISAEFRKMKRLWNPATQPGLITRREREAVLIENASWVMAPEEYIFI